jgi:UDP-N-acetylmuramyl tripeptide synthase
MADKIIITEDNSRTESFDSIVSDIAAGIEKKDFEIIKDRETAIRHAFKNARKGDVIAIIGKGHERYKIIQNEYISFDERFIIRDEMKKRGWSDES